MEWNRLAWPVRHRGRQFERGGHAAMEYHAARSEAAELTNVLPIGEGLKPIVQIGWQLDRQRLPVPVDVHVQPVLYQVKRTRLG